MQQDPRPAPASDAGSPTDDDAAEASVNLEVQEDAAKEREENIGYQ